MVKPDFTERAEKAREAVKKLIDKEMTIVQNSKCTTKIIFEVNFRDGGCGEVTVDHRSKISLDTVL